MSIHSRIRAARLAKELTEQQLADKVGVSRPAVQQWEKEGGTAPRRKIHDAVAAALGMTLGQLLGSEPWPANGTTATTARSIIGNPVLALAEGGEPEEGFVHVPLLANAGSMGVGNDQLHDDVLVGHIALSETWVSRRLQPTSQGALRFIHAYGDSMAPTMNSGDVLLVDTGVKEVKIDGIYVLRAHERLFVKRVRQRMDGKFENSSDNPTHKTVDVLNGDHEVAVIGRVVWAWNGHGM